VGSWLGTSNRGYTQAFICGAYSPTFSGSGTLVGTDANFVNPASAIWTQPLQVSGGLCFSGSGTGVNDSVAVLAGNNWCLNQKITSTLRILGGFGAAEVEHHLRMTITSTQIFSYEIDFVLQGNHIDIVKWLGNQGSFSVLSGGNAITAADGDLIESAIVTSGSSAIITVKQNGSLIASFTDTSPYTSGNPGLGGEGNGGTPSNLCWGSTSIVTS
jgi:hypothetical protein